MSIQVILTFNLKPTEVEKVKASFRDVLPDTRAFEGCEDISVIQSRHDPNTMVILERWAIPEAYESYFKWRTDAGTISMINESCTTPLEPKYYDFVRV